MMLIDKVIFFLYHSYVCVGHLFNILNNLDGAKKKKKSNIILYEHVVLILNLNKNALEATIFCYFAYQWQLLNLSSFSLRYMFCNIIFFVVFIAHINDDVLIQYTKFLITFK